MVRKSSFIYRVYDLYVDGFRRMTLGKTLWAVILVKLFIIFVILKWLFFPDFIKRNAPKGEESDFVSKELLDRINK